MFNSQNGSSPAEYSATTPYTTPDKYTMVYAALVRAKRALNELVATGAHPADSDVVAAHAAYDRVIDVLLEAQS